MFAEREGKCGFHYQAAFPVVAAAAPAAAVAVSAAEVVVSALAPARTAVSLEVLAVATPASAIIAVASEFYAVPTVLQSAAPDVVFSAANSVLILPFRVGAVPAAAATLAYFVADPVSAVSDRSSSDTQNTLNQIKKLTVT